MPVAAQRPGGAGGDCPARAGEAQPSAAETIGGRLAAAAMESQPAAEAPGRRAADGTDVGMPGGEAAEEGTNTAAALASLLAERVDLLERVDQLERGLEDLVAQVNYLSSALHSIQLARVPLA